MKITLFVLFCGGFALMLGAVFYLSTFIGILFTGAVMVLFSTLIYLDMKDKGQL